MLYNSLTNYTSKFLLMGTFLLYSLIVVSQENKNKYHSQLSVLDFYLMRLYEVEKCDNKNNYFTETMNWCLKEFPLINSDNIEMHFIIIKSSDLDKSLMDVSLSEQKLLIREDIVEFTRYYGHNSGLYYLADYSIQAEKDEEKLKKLMGLYFHYIVDDIHYITKNKI